MKNLATSKNDICLIAGSGSFVYEVANFLNNKIITLTAEIIEVILEDQKSLNDKNTEL